MEVAVPGSVRPAGSEGGGTARQEPGARARMREVAPPPSRRRFPERRSAIRADAWRESRRGTRAGAI